MNTAVESQLDAAALTDGELLYALARWHRTHEVGRRLVVELGHARDRQRLADMTHCAGLGDVVVRGAKLKAVRAYTLASTLGPGLRLVTCGLNPSPLAAEVGVGFARKGNRFWPALLAAGGAEVDRDPIDAFERFGIGMTDLVKRPTARADELTIDEYRDGFARLDRLVTWLQPAAICMVGLDGWRKAVDKKATTGWQPARVGSRPVYVMPNTSGLNASSTLADFVTHLRTAITGPVGPL